MTLDIGDSGVVLVVGGQALPGFRVTGRGTLKPAGGVAV